MKFCGECGAKLLEGQKFCGECGTKVGGKVVDEVNNFSKPLAPVTNEEVVLWEGKPGGLLDQAKDKARVNTTEYKLTTQRLIVTSGLIGKKSEETELVRIKDIKVEQSISARLQGVGNIIVLSTDVSSPTLKLENVQKVTEVKDMIRKAVRDEKARMGINYREDL